ncbi:ORF6C domain-containing protein, partial [Escherichia coli]
KQQQVPTDPMSILKLTFEALEGQKQELQHIKSDVKDLRENAPLFAVECDEILNAVKRHGICWNLLLFFDVFLHTFKFLYKSNFCLHCFFRVVPKYNLTEEAFTLVVFG